MKKTDGLFPRSQPKPFLDSKPLKPFLVNDQPAHTFASLKLMPETQLVMLVSRDAWRRLAQYIPAVEAVQLAGRFGASPGDYEWEWISNPESIRWWRRAMNGFEHLWGMAVGVEVKDGLELYGLVEIDEKSPFWTEVIPEEAALELPVQAKLMARDSKRPEEAILTELYRNYMKERGLLTQLQPGRAACRRGTIREVELFRDAIKGLLRRAIDPLRPDVDQR
jgi:hypothetical protein